MVGDILLEERIGALRACGERTVEAVERGVPLGEALSALVLEAERHSGAQMLGSVLLLEDGKRLREAAAPSLPAAYNAAIDGVEIGPAVGSCGTAAYYGEAVFVDDIKSDPLWVDFKDIALEHGLRACWSTPILDAQGRVLGTFATYYRQVRHPRPQDYEAIALLAGYVAKAIAASRAD